MARKAIGDRAMTAAERKALERQRREAMARVVQDEAATAHRLVRSVVLEMAAGVERERLMDAIQAIETAYVAAGGTHEGLGRRSMT